MNEERKESLMREWDYSDRMEDDEYQEWYEGLDDEEQAMIDEWDEQYKRGTLEICKKILAHEENKHE